MPNDPYAVLRALLRADAVRNAPKPHRTPNPAPTQPAGPQPNPRPTRQNPEPRPVLDEQPRRSRRN
ncbi:hypothetical protein ACIP79_07660 [Streptomyces sp. NPDC088747]|uniref:hypothetical protein n=1 Tax=Streptomyces sp. NPDC088747 TaxID=3365886 RepID=UPI0038179DB2